MAEGECQLGGRFRKCLNAPVERCQYCGRRFCADHQHVNKGFESVCVRDLCRRKQADLVAHAEYRARVNRRNAAGLCGIEECGPHPKHQCSLCQGNFCEPHVAQRMYPFRYGRVVIDRPASVCRWCWDRRKLWRH